MRTFALLLVGCTTAPPLLVGCTSVPPTSDPPSGVDDPAVRAAKLGLIAPEGCDTEVSLYGFSGAATPTLVPFTVDSDGFNICLELDARDNLVVAHLGASTPNEQDTTSSMFQLTLFAKDGTLLREGWDVTFGSAPPTTFANLEYNVDKGTVLEATLHIAAKCVPLGSQVSLALFEPYE